MVPGLLDYVIVLGLPVLVLLVISSDAVRLFIAGMYTYSGITAAHQDYKGLDAYVEYLYKYWIDFDPWVGICIAVFAVIIAVWTTQRVRKRVLNIINDK